MIKQTEITSKARGFTLVELLVVTVIIAVLAMIAIPQFNAYLNSAKVTVGIAALDTIRLNMEAYRDDHYGQYPVTINFANFTDQNGARIIMSSDPITVTSKLYSWNSYVVNGNTYTITAQALDSDHTVLTLTPQSITR
jgi:type IV pilus assembly protein PilA